MRALTGAAEQWVNAVLEQAPHVAVFDCDGTLWQPDSGYGFMRWSQAQGLLSRHASDWMDERYRGYRAGTISEAAICGEMVQVYTGLRDAEVRGAARRYFAECVQAHIFAEMQQLCLRLADAGTTLWAVSSTNDWVVEAGVVEHFSIPADRVLAARVRVEHGVVTDRLLAVPTDAAKADVLRKAGVTLPEMVFGNSVHDRAMLELAQHPCAVNPSKALLAHAEEFRWSVYWPEGCLESSRSPAAILRKLGCVESGVSRPPASSNVEMTIEPNAQAPGAEQDSVNGAGAGMQGEPVPRTSPKPAQGIRYVSAALILRGDRVLICQRRKDQPMANKWEFPGGKIERGETAEQALARELDEELCIHADIGSRVCHVRHTYRSGGMVDLQFFVVHHFRGELTNNIFQQMVWCGLRDLPQYDFLAADAGLVRDLAAGKLL